MYDFCRHCQTVFQSNSNYLGSYSQCTKFPIALLCCLHLPLSSFHFIQLGRWLVVSCLLLICMFLMSVNDDHLFRCSFTILMPSSVKCLSSSHFLVGLLFLNVKFWEILWILGTSSLSDTWFAQFSPSLWLVFFSSSHVLSQGNLFTFDEPSLSIFSFFGLCVLFEV